MAFVLASAAGGLLLILAQRMRPVEAWELVVQAVCGYSSFLVMGVAVGCGVSVFTYRRRKPQENVDEH